MKQIDLKRLREALPDRASLVLKKKDSVVYLDCFVKGESLTEEDFEMVKNWQREIIGKENIREFYTEDTGRDWKVYLKRIPMEFINLEDQDVNTYSGMEIVKTKIIFQ